MTIDEAIENLKAAKKGGTKSIVFAWWSADMFGREDDESWQHDAEIVEDKMDWSVAHENISWLLAQIAICERGNRQ